MAYGYGPVVSGGAVVVGSAVVGGEVEPGGLVVLGGRAVVALPRVVVGTRPSGPVVVVTESPGATVKPGAGTKPPPARDEVGTRLPARSVGGGPGGRVLRPLAASVVPTS